MGTPDAFVRMDGVQGGIDGNYLDGISITVNNFTSRTHVWSFVAGLSCSDNLPTFVGSGLACETPSHCAERELCGPLLWRSQQYGRNVSSWFKELPFPHVSDIEVRVCRDQMRFDEDLAITTFELYVQ